MNFFAKRPKTPVEVVRSVRDLVAPSGRLGAEYAGNYEGKKKVRSAACLRSPLRRQEADGTGSRLAARLLGPPLRFLDGLPAPCFLPRFKLSLS